MRMRSTAIIVSWTVVNVLHLQGGVASVPAVTMEDVLFEISRDEDGVLMAARLTTGKYEKNDFWNIIQESGGKWQDSFAEKPELVVVWNSYLARMGALEQREALQAPAWYRAKVEEATPPVSMDAGQVETVLKEYRLVERFQVGPYIVIWYERSLPGTDRKAITPAALRQFQKGRYQLTGELSASSLAMYLGSLAPGATDLDRPARRLAEDDLRSLLVFEELITLPAENERYATIAIHWRGEAARHTRETGGVYFYCNVDADSAKGYGLKAEKLASEQSRGSAAPEVRQVGQLLWRSLNVTNIEEQKTLWASSLGNEIQSKYQSARERQSQSNPEKAARKAIPGGRGIRPNVRVVASVPTEFGRLCYLHTKQAEVRPELFGQAVLVADAGKGVLSPALNVNPDQRRAGLIDAILIGQEFKAGLGEYLQKRHADVLERMEQE